MYRFLRQSVVTFRPKVDKKYMGPCVTSKVDELFVHPRLPPMARVDDKFRDYTWVGHNDIVDKMYLGRNIHWTKSVGRNIQWT
jgi:hypothetical protein